jgi:catechol 2,3-dioxygenase-like lactoylglutathione lyase family enzyme
MIDHVSVGVRDLVKATAFYTEILGVLGSQKLIERAGTVGFGKTYPEFWLNHRPEFFSLEQDNGCHICLRAPSVEVIDEFYSVAMRLEATSSGAPGLRPKYHESYYSCFIRDADNNHFEVVTFVPK